MTTAAITINEAHSQVQNRPSNEHYFEFLNFSKMHFSGGLVSLSRHTNFQKPNSSSCRVIVHRTSFIDTTIIHILDTKIIALTDLSVSLEKSFDLHTSSIVGFAKNQNHQMTRKKKKTVRITLMFTLKSIAREHMPLPSANNYLKNKKKMYVPHV